MGADIANRFIDAHSIFPFSLTATPSIASAPSPSPSLHAPRPRVHTRPSPITHSHPPPEVKHVEHVPAVALLPPLPLSLTAHHATVEVIRATVNADDANPLVGLVDVEGQGAEDSSYDTMLALPLLLTSRVVLFNHKGAPIVTEMLSKLGVLARAAEYVDLQEEAAGSGEEKAAAVDIGSSSASHNSESGSSRELLSAPTADTVAGTHSPRTRTPRSVFGAEKKKFGHLHILFRDFMFNASREEVFSLSLSLSLSFFLSLFLSLPSLSLSFLFLSLLSLSCLPYGDRSGDQQQLPYLPRSAYHSCMWLLSVECGVLWCGGGVLWCGVL